MRCAWFHLILTRMLVAEISKIIPENTSSGQQHMRLQKMLRCSSFIHLSALMVPLQMSYQIPGSHFLPEWSSTGFSQNYNITTMWLVTCKSSDISVMHGDLLITLWTVDSSIVSTAYPVQSSSIPACYSFSRRFWFLTQPFWSRLQVQIEHVYITGFSVLHLKCFVSFSHKMVFQWFYLKVGYKMSFKV